MLYAPTPSGGGKRKRDSTYEDDDCVVVSSAKIEAARPRNMSAHSRGRLYMCHCRAERNAGDVGMLACTECGELYHTKCLGMRKPPSNASTEYVCHHCGSGAESFGDLGVVGSFEDGRDVRARAIREHARLYKMQSRELAPIYMDRCGVSYAPLSLGKNRLIRRILYARFKEDFDGVPLPYTGVMTYAFRPRCGEGLTVAQKLHDDLMELAQEIPGVGVEAESAPTSQTEGLLPHIMRHLYTTFSLHVQRGDRRGFHRRFVGALDHWNGVHHKKQCLHAVCVQGGFMPGHTAEERARATARLRSILIRTSKQYAVDATRPPAVQPYDPEHEGVDDNWPDVIGYP